MADNTNAQVIKHVNEQTRPCADRAISAIRTMRQYVANYASDGIAALVVPDPTTEAELIADGSATDGRTPLNGFDVDQFDQKCVALLAWIDSQSGLEATLTKPSVNTQPVF